MCKFQKMFTSLLVMNCTTWRGGVLKLPAIHLISERTGN